MNYSNEHIMELANANMQYKKTILELKKQISFINDKININVTTNNNVIDSNNIYKFYNSQLSGTNGGNAIKNQWNTIEINKFDTSNNTVYLNNNHLIVKHGLYKIEFATTFYSTGNTKIRVRETTQDKVLCESINKYLSVQYLQNDVVDIDDYIHVPSNMVYTLIFEYFSDNDVEDIGLGIPCAFLTNELYTKIILTKL
jgi:hypothetical protein